MLSQLRAPKSQGSSEERLSGRQLASVVPWGPGAETRDVTDSCFFPDGDRTRDPSAAWEIKLFSVWRRKTHGDGKVLWSGFIRFTPMVSREWFSPRAPVPS